MTDPIALAWHDVVCPEGVGCDGRALHATSHPLYAGGLLQRFLDRLRIPVPPSEPTPAGCPCACTERAGFHHHLWGGTAPCGDDDACAGCVL